MSATKRKSSPITMAVKEDGTERLVEVELTDPTEEAAIQAEVAPPPPERVARATSRDPISIFMGATRPRSDGGWIGFRWERGAPRPAMVEWFKDRNAAGERCKAEREQFPDKEQHYIARRAFSSWEVMTVDPTGETKIYMYPFRDEAEHLQLRLTTQSPELRVEIAPHVPMPPELAA